MMKMHSGSYDTNSLQEILHCSDSNISSDTQGDILKAMSAKIRKQVISFQLTMAKNTPSQSNR